MKQKIIQLAVENIKKIRALLVKPDGTVFLIGGRNAQGKSAVLDAIEYALRGKDAIPGEPIRHGENSGRIVLETDRLLVTRTFTKTNSYLKVKYKDGTPITGGPQGVLDALYGDTIDPVAFLRMKPHEQAAQLAVVAGIDLENMASRRQVHYDQRTDINRDLKATKARVRLDINPDDLVEPVDVTGLSLALKARMDHNRDVEDTRAKFKLARKAVEIAEHELRGANGVLAALTIAAEGATVLDIKEIETQLHGADETNRRVALVKEQHRIRADIEEMETQVEHLNEFMADIDTERDEAIASADLPVSGLTVDEQMVRFNGVPFDQCSSSERIKVSTALALAANPELPVVLIRDGSLLDTDSRATVAQMAEKAGAQVFMERVLELGESADLIIEDGSPVT